RLGDIDVLAWHSDSDRVLLLECKDLHFRKSMGEMAEQVQDYRGEVRDGQRDDMRKHIDRTEALRTNAEAVGKYIGCRGSIPIESWIVFRHPVPVLLSWREPSASVRVTTFAELKDIVAGGTN